VAPAWGRPARLILSAMDTDAEFLLRLRSGDEGAFASLVERYHEPMLRLAASFVPSRAVAEEVVQDTWLAVLRGRDGFEGRSSLNTWVSRILVNRARTTGAREQRSVPVADPEPVVDPARFDASGSWADPPEHWMVAAEDRTAAGKLADRSEPGSTSCPPASAGSCSCPTSRGRAAKRSARCSTSAR
jgi:RNA polymerase sigma-70 factor (ECF subfamily)